jgi:type I restriction enzyme M protein
MIKEMNLEDINPLAALKNKLSWVFNLIRNTAKVSEYHFVLYLLTLHRYGFLKGIYFRNHSELNQQIKRSVDNLENVTPQFESLIIHYEQIINEVDITAINELINLFNSQNAEILEEHFSEIFDDLLYKFMQSGGRAIGESILPMELSRFVSSLAVLTKVDNNVKGGYNFHNVYNPFAGLASFELDLEKGTVLYYGQELNHTIWLIGILRLMAYDRSPFLYEEENSLEKWRYSLDIENSNLNSAKSKFLKFDLVISNPPFAMSLPIQVAGKFGNIRSYEHFLIEKGIESLNDTGQLIAVLSQSFLFRSGSEANLRQYLIEEDLLEMVVSFPSGLLMNSAASLVIVVISKNKKEKGRVRFVDAQNFVESSLSKERKLNDYKLNSVIRNSTNSDVIRIVTNESIAANDFNLNVPRYFQREFYGAKLGDVGTIIRGRRVSEGQKGKFVRIRDLKDDKLNFQLSVEQIDDVALPRQVQCIEESCIIMALRWKTLKPTFFNYAGTPIYLTPDTLAFSVDESKADAAFLINELNAGYVVEQLNAYRIGVTIPAIRRDDLLNVKIDLPSIEEQRAKVTGILEISAKINQLQAERNALAHGFGQKQFNEFASLKHTLGTPRQNILSYAEALISFFEKNPSAESEKVSAAFKEKMGVDLTVAFQAIKHDINFISELLEKGENGLILKDYELSLVPLPDVLKYIQQLCKNHNYNFLSFPPNQIHDLAKKEADRLGIRINLSLLKILFDNIFSNAHKYAFDKKLFSANQTVVVELGITDEGFFINIINNGKPFPKNMDKDKFISKYKTSDEANGTGLGGYDINRIAEYFDSEWFLRLNTDPLFPVQFSFWFKPLSIK